jgi:hypothetical protein
MTSEGPMQGEQRIGRYTIYDEIAAGGMASVHVGRLLGEAGFTRTVAIKRLHAEVAKDPEFVDMFLAEAHLAARIRHPNVVSTLDVVQSEGELLLIMEYVEGESLSRLRRACAAAGESIPVGVSVAILCGVLQGLHAAHEATTEKGEPMHLVHRDVSPQNIVVGSNGNPTVVDFGVAKAAGRLQTTRDGQVKGKAGYMAPEQLRGSVIDRRADVFAAGVVLWELLTGERLFQGDSPAATMMMVLEREPPPPSSKAPAVSPALDAIVLRALCRTPSARFDTALAMADALEGAVRPATPREVGSWVKLMAGDVLRARAAKVAAVEAGVSFEAPSTALSLGAIAGEPASQVSSISVASSRAEPKPGARAKWAFLTGIGAVGAALAALSLPRGIDPRPSAAQQTLVEEAVAPTASSNPREEVPVTAANADAGMAKVRPHVRPVPLRRPNCNPPYTVDPSGIHLAKPACL